LICPGVPVVINNSSSSANMRSLGLTVGAPECALVTIGTAQMAKFYGWPCRSGGAISDAKIVDAQAGAESMLNLLTSALTGTNYILHACGIMEAYMVSSFEKFIVDEENCGIVKHIRKGIPVNEETLAFDTIKDVVAQQSAFLTQPNTFEYYRTLHEPRLYDRKDYVKWEEKGSEDIALVANREWKKRVEEYIQPALSPDMESALKAYVDKVSS
jgi:trimethylamine--corrinoid protein Co-methyltransferase